MQLTKTHEEPTSDSRTGTATYFRGAAAGTLDALKVTAYAPLFRSDPETRFAVHVFRENGWVQVIGLVETDSPELAARKGMEVLCRQ